MGFRYNRGVNIEDMDNEKIAEFYAKKLGTEISGWLGGGEYGDAYETGDGNVIKVTSSPDEMVLIDLLLNKVNDHIADYYHYAVIKNGGHEYYVINMEKLDIDCDVEGLFFDMGQVFMEMGLQYDYPDHFDIDDAKEQGVEVSEVLEEFIDKYTSLVWEVKNIGIDNRDYNPENLGYKGNGNLAIFDMMAPESRIKLDTSKICSYMMESIKRKLRESLLKENFIPSGTLSKVAGISWLENQIKVKGVNSVVSKVMRMWINKNTKTSNGRAVILNPRYKNKNGVYNQLTQFNAIKNDNFDKASGYLKTN